MWLNKLRRLLPFRSRSEPRQSGNRPVSVTGADDAIGWGTLHGSSNSSCHQWPMWHQWCFRFEQSVKILGEGLVRWDSWLRIEHGGEVQHKVSRWVTYKPFFFFFGQLSSKVSYDYVTDVISSYVIIIIFLLIYI